MDAAVPKVPDTSYQIPGGEPKKGKKTYGRGTCPNVGTLLSIDPYLSLYQIGGNPKDYQIHKFQDPGSSIYDVINLLLSKLRFKMSYLQKQPIVSREPASRD